MARIHEAHPTVDFEQAYKRARQAWHARSEEKDAGIHLWASVPKSIRAQKAVLEKDRGNIVMPLSLNEVAFERAFLSKGKRHRAKKRHHAKKRHRVGKKAKSGSSGLGSMMRHMVKSMKHSMGRKVAKIEKVEDHKAKKEKKVQKHLMKRAAKSEAKMDTKHTMRSVDKGLKKTQKKMEKKVLKKAKKAQHEMNKEAAKEKKAASKKKAAEGNRAEGERVKPTHREGHRDSPTKPAATKPKSAAPDASTPATKPTAPTEKMPQASSEEPKHPSWETQGHQHGHKNKAKPPHLPEDQDMGVWAAPFTPLESAELEQAPEVEELEVPAKGNGDSARVQLTDEEYFDRALARAQEKLPTTRL
jgi:hypothetical protein